MDTKSNGLPSQSYEARNDLAIRSAAGDPLAGNPQSPTHQRRKSSITKAPSSDTAKGTPTKPSESSHSSHNHAKKSSLSGFTNAQIQNNETAPSTKPKEHDTPSKATTRLKERKISTKVTSEDMESAAGLPDFLLRRNALFDKLKQEAVAEVLAKEKPEIDVVLDLGVDGNGVPRPTMPVAAKAWESTPGSFLRHVDKDISNDVVIAKVDGKRLWDLDRPLEYACRVSYIPFSSAEGRNVFWHSSAHVLGEAAECQYNCLLSHGPPVEQGFFYDMALSEG